jgi:hypothetical protein
MIVHTCFNNSSEHGYKSSVLKSGICKYTRRDEKEKMRWCVMEMAAFNEHPKGQGLITNLINRLKVLIMEELSFHETVISSYLIHILDMYDKKRDDYRLLYSFCDIVFEAKRNRCVSYQNAWWRSEDFEPLDLPLDKVDRYKKKGDSDELLLLGENLIKFIEEKDERMFGCYMELCKMDDQDQVKQGQVKQGIRYRRKAAAYLWFEIISDYMNTGDLQYIFEFALKQFQKIGMTERYAFGIWLGMMMWKRDTLTVSEEGIPYVIASKEEAERYMVEMTKLKIDDYVINDYHVNSKKFGLGNFAEHGAHVVNEYMDLLDDAEDKQKWYIKEKKMKDKFKEKDKIMKKKKKKEPANVFSDNYYLEKINWSEFTDVKILEEGVCGGKVCCISAMYKDKKYILKEMGPSMNYGKDYILIDKCKKVFGLQDMNMVRILSDKGQLKIDASKKSYVNNVEIGDKKCVYCMMDYWENMGDLGKNKDMLQFTLDGSLVVNVSVKKESLKIRLFDGLFRSSDNILRNILVIPGGALLSIDEGDIYGKREKVFNKTDWHKKNCSQEEFNEALDDLLSNEEDKLKVVKEQMKYYEFSNDIYETFEQRFKNYKDIVKSELC